ncbi:MAG TPA: class I SAM-dependent methyltransferase [Nocardioides sp.]|uniref:class I SAM-dependent methyltransferase n=1 Tax=uncultured Nocardioides sp. TaxID=198441 RepID=UPI000EC55F9B|nr:class I SAM-dependent methyltransferase [uncultured Nocardioides sp.]HCB07868.1 SAM-dependent methyltransferase [Nocardioides sp.]HRD64394.1 class I SAM-dependent methyltransferase [Nocardioides sp.]HRI98687.1 class I SAM-dependent methyltransferase [Nocardioides sp.]
MAFGSADSYARFMGRFSEPLAPLFADVLTEFDGRLLDVGCGPGVLTAELVGRYGAARVDAIDPTPGFVAAARNRLPEVDIREGTAEELPYADDTYGAAYAQLVVHFMKDPVRGLAEMARVTAPGGPVAACVWDHGGGRGPLSPFWSVVAEFDPAETRELNSAGSRAGDLARLFGEAGLVDVIDGELSVTIHLDSFDEWWAPYEERVGTVGDYLSTRTPAQVTELRDRCHAQLGDGPFDLTAVAWTATGRSPQG